MCSPLSPHLYMSACSSDPSNHKVYLEAGFSSLLFFFFLVKNSVAKVICQSPCAVVVNLSMKLEQSAEL